MNSFNSQSQLKSGNRSYEIFRLGALASKGVWRENLPYRCEFCSKTFFAMKTEIGHGG